MLCSGGVYANTLLELGSINQLNIKIIKTIKMEQQNGIKSEIWGRTTKNINNY